MELNDNFIVGNTGDTVLFSDTTGNTAPYSYGKNGVIAYSAVTFFRLRIATLSSINNTTGYVAGDTLPINVELLCTEANAVTIDSKTINSGDYFVPRTTGIVVPANCTFVTTGNFVYIPTAFNATQNLFYQVPTTLSLAEINQSTNTFVEDDLYILSYEIYYDRATTTTAAVDGQSYIVTNGTATFDGSTYRQGEVFTANSTANITTTGDFSKLYASSTTYFTLVWNMLQTMFSIIENNTDESISAQIFGIRCELESLQFSCATSNISFTYCQKILEKLQGKITYLYSIS
jgi:hypothetical protein